MVGDEHLWLGCLSDARPEPRTYVYTICSAKLTLLEPQSRSGDKPLKFQVVLSPNGTAVLNGLKLRTKTSSSTHSFCVLLGSSSKATDGMVWYVLFIARLWTVLETLKHWRWAIYLYWSIIFSCHSRGFNLFFMSFFGAFLLVVVVCYCVPHGYLRHDRI